LAHATYHVFARGNGKQRIFLDERDHENFLGLLDEVLSRFAWQCFAYCLMPNHYHLVVKTSNPNLSQGMRHINGVYAQRFNRRHDRVGHVFQGRFGSTLIQADEHLLEAIRYVVRNPIRAGLAGRTHEWPWSSQREVLGSSGRGALAISELMALFGVNATAARNRYLEFTETEPRNNGLGSGPVWGDCEFMDEHLPKHWPSKKISAANRRRERPPLTDLRSDGDLDRAVTTAYRVHGYTLCEIAAVLRCHHTTVSRRIRRYETRASGSQRPPSAAAG
jgi:putative transposase